jgi:hypothetical protein
MLRGGRGSAIVAHLPLIAVLFPDLVDGNDAERTAALTNAGDAVRSVYERLFVKLRIPGYDVTPYDLEDAAMRDAVVTLLDDLAGPSAHGQTAADLRIEFAPAALRDARSRLVQAPLGGIDGVATAAMLVPRSGTGTVAAALGASAALLAEELETARSLAHDAFAAYVTMHRIDALDAARERALAALAPVASLA